MKKITLLSVFLLLFQFVILAQGRGNNNGIIYTFGYNEVPSRCNLPLVGFINTAHGDQKSVHVGFINTNLGDPDYVPPGQFVQPPCESTSKEVIDYAHSLGLKVHPWTVNDAETINLLMGRGVDGIMTDDPALLEGLIP